MDSTAARESAASPPHPPARLTAGQLARLSALWFGLQFFWVSQQMIVMPERVKHFAPIEHLGAYYGLVKACGALVVIATQLTTGFISDHAESRLGRRRPFIIHGILWGCAGVACFIFAPGYWWLFAAYLLIEATINVASVPFQSLLPDLVPESQHNQAGSQMGLMHLAGNLAGLLAVVAMKIVFAGKEWQVFGDIKPGGYGLLLLAYLALLIGTAAIVVFGIDEQRWAQHAHAKLDGAVRTLRLLPGLMVRFARTAPTLLGCMVHDYRQVDLRRQPNFNWLAASRFTIFLGYQTFLTYVAYYVESNLDGAGWLASLGVSGEAAKQLAGAILPAVLTFFILGGLAGTLLSAPLAGRFRKKGVIGGGLVLAGVMVVPLIFTSNVWVAVGAGCLLGVGWGAFLAADWAFACTLMPKQRTGSFMGIWDVTTLLPQVLAPVIAAPIRDGIFNAGLARLGGRGADAFAIQWLYATIILYFIAGLALLARVREARPH
jgi:Na+/melibiose symporter-like transporter